MEDILLQIQELSVGFHKKDGFQEILKKVSFEIAAGEIVGMVGESGSGKSLTSLTIMDLLGERAEVTNGRILFQGKDLLTLSDKERQRKKGNEISMIFQEPMTSLNPLMKVGAQVEEVLRIHNLVQKEQYREKTLQMLKEVGLKEVESLFEQYPHQLSGGMRQRVMIAMAMIGNPKLLIADEPTTALDVTVQAQILQLIRSVAKKHNTAVLLISHDLGVIKSICSRAYIMYEGQLVESGTIENIFEHPKNEYTKRLLQAVPSLDKTLLKEDKEKHRLAIQETGKKPILSISHLTSYYERTTKILFGKKEMKKILDDVSLEVKEGEIYGIVGESGSGKSTLAKAVTGLLEEMSGEIIKGDPYPQMVFQDPYSSLNRAKTIGWILEEPLKIKGGFTKAERKEKVVAMLEAVGLSKDYATRRIHQLSGGQRQRVAIGAALITNARFIILDEPVSALDVTIQEQILKLLKKLQVEYNLSYLFISHDMNVVYQLCDRISVMYEGRIVETAKKEVLYTNPQHEYTKKLIESMPKA